MKVIYLTTESYYQEPIIKSQVEPLIDFLSKENFEFTLVTFEKQISLSDSKSFIHVQYKFRSHLLNMLYLIFYTFKISNKDDIIHVRSYPPMIAALIVRLINGNKIIFDPRGLWPEEMSYSVNRPIITFVFKQLEKFFCKFSSNIILVSKAFENLFIERYPSDKSKFSVIPTFSLPLNSVNSNAEINLKKQIFNNENSILFVYSGSFESWQKIEIIVEYFQFLELNLENSRFLFLTKAKDLFDNYLKDKLSVDKYYIYSANQANISSYLSQCDYGIIFRDKHIINQVSAPIKIKDYLTSNLRVLLSDNIGDSSELINLNRLGYIFSDYSIKSKEDSLKYIKSINYRENYFTNSDILEKFSLKSVANQYKLIYNEL
jgi:hypothetical protein